VGVEFVGFKDEDDGAGVGAEGVGFFFAENSAHAGMDIDVGGGHKLRDGDAAVDHEQCRDAALY